MRVVYGGKSIDLADTVRQILRPDRKQLYDPWFESYHQWFGEDRKVDRYVRYLKTLLAQAGVQLEGASVLDAGCGFGLTALFLNLLGAGEVHGLDCHAGMIRTFNAYLTFLPYDLRTYPCLGDVAEMPYADGAFDLVLSIEAVSHYRHWPQFLAEAARVLRPGGTLVIADSNNRRHRRTVRRTHRIWAAFENGPPTENIFGHRVTTPFVAKRLEMLENAYPNLSVDELDELSRQTSGLWGKHVLVAADAYVARGVWPNSRWDGRSCPLDPTSGCYIENLLDPLELVDRLRRLGLRAWARAYFGGARGGVVQLANRLMTPPALSVTTLLLSSAYRVFARRQDDAE